MIENNKTQIIDLRKICSKLRTGKWKFVIIIPIVIVLSCLYIFSMPRYYSTDTKLAPEVESTIGEGGLSSIASSFGIDISDVKSSDAITPLLYPDLMKDNNFISNLFDIHVTTEDGTLKTTYFKYLDHYQKEPWWGSLFHKKTESIEEKVNPYALTKEQEKIVNIIREDITLNVDSKNGVITITTKSQDPLICKTLADSVRMKLQEFITTYRTNKARNDVDYYKKLTSDAKEKYERARQIYGSYSDSNSDVILESYKSKQEDLENEMQLKFNSYSSLNTQLQAAIAKVQERTPVFTLLKGAAVPIRPAGPKRMVFVFVMLIIATIFTSLWILRKDVVKILA